MHKQDILLFIIGLIIPVRTIAIRIVMYMAQVTGQIILKEYIEDHILYPKRPNRAESYNTKLASDE